MNAKDYRLQRDEALQQVAELKKLLPDPKAPTKKDILDKHDKWLLRILNKRSHKLDELERFWLFRDLMFKHWNKFN